jgi:hypothetical protein
MEKGKRLIAAMLLVLTFSASMLAQTRIQIPRGRYSTTVTGTLPFNYYRKYVVRARAGQSIEAYVTSTTGQVVFAEDYETKYFLDLVEGGDVIIDIMNLGPTSTYRLMVRITRTPR